MQRRLVGDRVGAKVGGRIAGRGEGIGCPDQVRQRRTEAVAEVVGHGAGVIGVLQREDVTAVLAAGSEQRGEEWPAQAALLPRWIDEVGDDMAVAAPDNRRRQACDAPASAGDPDLVRVPSCSVVSRLRVRAVIAGKSGSSLTRNGCARLPMSASPLALMWAAAGRSSRRAGRISSEGSLT
ncbi:MAG: hypothetical protein R2853_05105 [Thermomicrobiales bacterium]